MTRRSAAWVAAIGSVAAFVAACFLRMNAEYGPFNLSFHPSDWTLLWELFRHGQIAPRVGLQSAGLGAAAALVPWIAFALLTRRRGTP